MTRVISIFVATACVLAAVPAQEVSDAGTLMNEFAKAVKVDDFAKQTSLLDANKKFIEPGFMSWETSWCRLSALENDEAAKTNADAMMAVMEALASVNSIKGNRNNFLLLRVPWLQGLTKEQKDVKVKMRTIVDAAAVDFNRLAKVPAEEDIRKLVPNYAVAVGHAASATDYYWAANCCWLAGDLMKKIPDWYAATYWYKKGAGFGEVGHTRDMIQGWVLAKRGSLAAATGKVRYEYVDVAVADLAESKKNHDAAVEKAAASALAAGHPDGSGGVGVGKKDGAKGSVGANMAPPPNKHAPGANKDWEETTGLKMSKVRKYPAVSLPYFRANAHWYFWTRAGAEKGQAMAANLLPGETVIENDRGKLFLHPGGKGAGKPIRLKVGPKAKVLEFKKVKYSDGSVGKVWHDMMLIPSSFSINGFQMRSNGNVAAVAFRGATVAKGKVRGESLQIYDANGDGKFDTWGADYIVIGKGKKAKVQPMSKYVTLGGLLYEFKIDQSGKAIRTRPYDGPVAPLKFDYKSNMLPISMLARGQGEDGAYVYDLMRAIDTPIWVVPGGHSFHEGYMGAGKGAKRQTVWIQKGRSGTFNVETGTLNKWEMGGAGETGFTFTFKAETRREKGKSMIVVPGKDVQIYGAGGELYRFSMFGQVTPAVQVRKGKDGPIVIRTKMRKPERSDLSESSDAMWSPKPLVMKKDFTGDYSVKLEANYKILGKITSDWTAGN